MGRAYQCRSCNCWFGQLTYTGTDEFHVRVLDGARERLTQAACMVHTEWLLDLSMRAGHYNAHTESGAKRAANGSSSSSSGGHSKRPPD